MTIMSAKNTLNMKYTGIYDPIECGYDLDEKINEVARLTIKFIADLKEEVGQGDYNVIAKTIIQEYLNAM